VENGWERDAVQIKHGMRPDILEGITAIGIRVEKVE
jgi:hypothetical protein